MQHQIFSRMMSYFSTLKIFQILLMELEQPALYTFKSFNQILMKVQGQQAAHSFDYLLSNTLELLLSLIGNRTKSDKRNWSTHCDSDTQINSNTK